VAAAEIFAEGFHGTIEEFVDATSILYFSLFVMISSSLELICSIFLDSLCRTITCVVNPVKKLIKDRVLLGYLYIKRNM
jgi:hypothetical protein